MKNHFNKRRVFQLSGVLVTLTAVTLFIGHGCSGYESNSSLSQQTAITANTGSCAAKSLEVKPIEGAETLSVAYGQQVLDNMLSCTGLATPSQRTMDEYDARKGSFSQFGSVADVTSAMMMGVAALAIEVCNDIATKEEGLSSSERQFFANFDFASTSSDPGLVDASRRFARACWGRNATDEEIGVITAKISQLNANSTPAHYKAIGLCTSVLASIDGILQ